MITQIGGSVARKLKGEMQTAFTDENIDYTVGLQVVDPFQGYIYENEEYFPEPQAVPFETQFFPDELAAGKWKKQKKWATKRDVKGVTDSVNNLHTKREAIEWCAGLKVTDPLQLYVHDGIEYLPKVREVPFTTGSNFDSGKFNSNSLATIDYVDNYAIFTRHDPRFYGAEPNNPNFDCLPMLIKARNTGKLLLGVGLEYFVSDEFILTTGLVVECEGGGAVVDGEDAKANISAMSTFNVDPTQHKAVVRAASLPIGQTPNMSTYAQQITALIIAGKLVVDSKRVAEYAFYGRGISNEFAIDYIVGKNSKVCNVSLMTSWYGNINTLQGLKGEHNVAVGIPLSGETGDVFVNAIPINAISSWSSYNTNPNNEYDPTGNRAQKMSRAGVLFGKALSTKVGVLTSEWVRGAGLFVENSPTLSIDQFYAEECSRDCPNGKKAAYVDSHNGGDHSTVTIGQIHLAGGQKIATVTSGNRLTIENLYRFDSVPSFIDECLADSVKLENANYYTKLGYNYAVPDCIIKPAPAVVMSKSNIDAKSFTQQRFAVTELTKGNVTVVPSVTLSGDEKIQLTISGEGGSDTFNVTGDGLYSFSLSRVHNTKKYYTIQLNTSPRQNCTYDIVITDNQYFW